MWGRPGDDSKPQVKLKVRTIRALKKYAKEPKCLRCGYDLRGQITANRGTCPECGQACQFEDLAEQIAGQKAGFLPVLNEIRLGLLAVFCLPILLFMIWLAIVMIAGELRVISFDSDLVLWLLAWPFGFIWCVLWILSVVPSFQVFKSSYGIWLWFLSQVHFYLFLALLAPAFIWIVMVADRIAQLLDGSHELTPIHFYLTSVWTYVVAIPGSGLLFYFNQRCSGRFVITPCRRRCRALVLEYLQTASTRDLSRSSPLANQ